MKAVSILYADRQWRFPYVELFLTINLKFSIFQTLKSCYFNLIRQAV